MIDDGDGDYGAVGGMKIGRGNRSTRKKSAPEPLSPPQIPHDQTQARTRAAAVGNQRLTAWAMARPCRFFLPSFFYFIFTQLVRTYENRRPLLFSLNLFTLPYSESNIFVTYFSKNNYDITLPSMLRSSKCYCP
jgi:hypothetical protein